MGERFQLSRARLREIREAPAFQCHKTVDYDGVEDEDGEVIPSVGDRPQQCAGLMTVLHRIGEPNSIMRVAMRLGQFDPSTLDPEREVYTTWAKVAKAHRCP